MPGCFVKRAICSFFKSDNTVSNPVSGLLQPLSMTVVGRTELSLKNKLILNFTAISLLMVLSTALGTTSPVTIKEIPKVDTVDIVKKISPKEIENIMSTEQYVRSYFADLPIMVHIAECESHFKQLDSDGEIHRGKVNPEDVGVMQINEHYHLGQSEKGNYNIYTLEGNTAYARDLYERQGTKPWSSSRACWGKYLNNDLALNTIKK